MVKVMERIVGASLLFAACSSGATTAPNVVGKSPGASTETTEAMTVPSDVPAAALRCAKGEPSSTGDALVKSPGPNGGLASPEVAVGRGMAIRFEGAPPIPGKFATEGPRELGYVSDGTSVLFADSEDVYAVYSLEVTPFGRYIAASIEMCDGAIDRRGLKRADTSSLLNADGESETLASKCAELKKRFLEINPADAEARSLCDKVETTAKGTL